MGFEPPHPNPLPSGERERTESAAQRFSRPSCPALCRARPYLSSVMPALGAGIHVLLVLMSKDVDGRDKCSVRGHDRHLFGDITDTFRAGQVNVGDLVGAEEDAVAAIGGERPNGDAFAAERLRHFPQPTYKADVVLAGRHGEHCRVLTTLNMRHTIE